MRVTRLRIPAGILRAARAAGLKEPSWWVGPREPAPGPRKHTLEDIVRSIDEKEPR